MENSYDEECFKKWEIDECEAEMEKVDRKEETAWTCTGCVYRREL